MKLGIFMMPLHSPERPLAETLDEDLEVVAWADKLGYEEAWIGEHFTLPWENIPAPDLFIARALGVTERIVMGTGVVLLHLHDPTMVAHRIAMLDHMAKGRLIFGIGSGATPADSELFGIDRKPGTSRRMMQESIEVILKLWTEGEPVEHSGEFFHVRTPEAQPEARLAFHSKPYQKPYPPIAVGGSSPRSETLELAGENGWWPMSSCFLHSSRLTTHWQAVETGAQKTGQNASRTDWRIAREVYVAEDSQQAKDDALSGAFGQFFTDYWTALIGHGPRGIASLKADPDMPDEAITPEYMLEQFWIVGDPDECARKIRKLYSDAGGFGTLLPICHDWGKDKDKWFRSLELLVKEVQPSLRDLVP